ncbi:MAG TPA: alkaline phosphatase family protein [Usitatibacter sp.]|nr:alkaline phosphatase family protein [Usitatibacter sp.]
MIRASLRLAAALLAAAILFPAWAEPPARASLFVVLVLDGLRPDSINATDMPNLARLRGEGVTFLNSHSVFPTVTRVNATAIGTGDYPARNGIMGNRIYVPEVDPVSAFTNDDAAKLLVMGDHIVTAPGLAEILQRAGERFVAVSSGSTGGALLVAPRSPEGIGLSLNAGFQSLPQSGKLKAAIDEVAHRFGAPPRKGGAAEGHEEAVTWAMRVFDDYVLAELKPRVALSWMTEPDHSQHAYGPGSAQALAAIRNDDAEIGKLLAKLESLGLAGRTDILVVSDHGFSHTTGEVNVAQAFKDAGFRLSEDGGDVVIASSGQAIAVHVKGHDAQSVASIAKFLQSQPWCGLVFTARGDGAPFEGRAPGTFALEYAHLGGHERSPDLVFTFPWSSERNRFGVRGGDWDLVGKGATGPVTTDRANHGGIGPWTVTNTMLAWGPDFKRGVVVRAPAANVDVAPTILHLLGMKSAGSAMDGRPLVEAMVGGPDEEQVPIETRTLQVSSGSYRALLQVTEIGGRRYIDKGWRP